MQMKAFLTSILLTLVCFILDTPAWADAATECAAAKNTMDQACADKSASACAPAMTVYNACVTEASRRQSDLGKESRDECKEAVKEMDKVYNELISACKQVARQDRNCMKVAQACQEINSTEQDTGTLNAFAQAFNINLGGRFMEDDCMNAHLTRQQWKEDRDSAKRELEAKKKEFKELQDKAAQVGKDASKTKASVEEKAVELDKQFAKLQKEAEEAGETEQAKFAEDSRKAFQQMREMESQRLALINAKATKLQERAAILETLTDALISADCQVKLQEFVRKYRTAGRSSIVQGGANSAMGGSNSLDQAAQATWASCYNGAIAQRNATMTKYKNEISAIDLQMEHLNSDYAAAQQRLNELSGQQSRAFTRRGNNNSQAAQNYQNERMSLMNRYNEALQQAQQDSVRYQGQLTTIQAEENEASNKLAKLEAHQPGGDKTYNDVKTNASKVMKETEKARNVCNCDSETTKDKKCSEITKMKDKMRSEILKSASGEEFKEYEGTD
jgi:hypothetical protein